MFPVSCRPSTRHPFPFPTELGIYPAVDPLDSTSRMLNPRILGEEHYGGECSLSQGSCT